MVTIDLNCDMGEGMPYDADIMPFISSANIACGYHAGDADTIKRTIDLALKYNVAIGAHPGFADKQNFGRLEQQLSAEAYYNLVREQLLLFQKFVDDAGATLHHVKPHGALYNMSAKNSELAHIIAKAAKDHHPTLVLYGLSNSVSVTEAKKIGIDTCSEVFADRTYTDEGMLTPRTNSNAIHGTIEGSVKQVLQMIFHKTVTSVNNKTILITAETICIHGDHASTNSMIKQLHHSLVAAGVNIKAR